MRFDLAAMARAKGKRRDFALPPIAATKAQADTLAAIYLHVTAAWSTVTEGPVIAAYTQSLAARVGDAVAMRDSIPGAAIDGAAEAINRLLLTLAPGLRQWAVTVDRVHRARFAAGVLSASGVDLQTMIGPQDAQETIDDVLARNVELVRNVSDVTRGRIADIVFRGLQARSPAADVAREMREAVGLGRARSIRIASDQTTKLSAALDAERQRQAGLTEWIWRWSHKRHGRPVHMARDGKHYTDETAPADLPGMLPWCGCRRQAFVRLN